MRQALWCVLGVILLAQLCDAASVQTEFRVPGQTDTYRARVSSDWITSNLSQQLDVSVKVADDRDWVVTDRIELTGLSCCPEVRYITLGGEKGNLPGLLVSGDGDTRNFVYVVQMLITVPSLVELKTFVSTHHEGGKPRLQFDKKGNLQALTLQYAAMHELPDSMFPGHIVVARAYKWIPEKHEFVKGPWYVDSRAERDLSLSDALVYPGSYRLGVSFTYDERAKTTTRRFRPAGILKDKLPENLKSAPMVEVVMGPDRIVSMKSVNVTKK